MIRYIIVLTNDEWQTPRYVEKGLGFRGVSVTTDKRNAGRYNTLEEAEKIAALARTQKNKEPGGETTAVEIVVEGAENHDGWETRFRFELPASGKESCLQMRKTSHGIESRYVTFDGRTASADSLESGFREWLSCIEAWGVDKIRKKGKQ